MQQINEKSHYSTIISSLNKEYKQSKIGKTITPNDIYLLDVVYNLLQGCCLELNNIEIKKLLKIYNTVLHTSKIVCNNNYQEVYQMSKKDKFIQAEKTDCNTIANLQKIYYWQEPNIDILLDDIINNVSINGYLQTKSFDTIPVFEIGKTISYTSIGLISFAITNSLETDNYRLYDIMNNDVTNGFTRTYLDNKTILFVSNNIYTNSDMFIKLKKSISPILSLTPFDISVNNTTDYCTGIDIPILDNTAYHTGTGIYPVPGDIIYDDLTGTNFYTPSLIYNSGICLFGGYSIGDGTLIFINDLGIVEEGINVCGCR